MIWLGILAVAAITSIYGILILSMDPVFSMLVLLVSGGGLVFYVLIIKRFSKLFQHLILGGASAFCILVLINTGAPSKDPFGSYKEECAAIEKDILSGAEDEKALADCDERIKRLEDRYGVKDMTRSLKALMFMVRGDFDQAGGEINYFSDKRSFLYYGRLEQRYLWDIGQDRTNDLYRLYENMVIDIPDSVYARKMAGIAQFEKKNYKGVDFLLCSALELDDQDPLTLYYLGASSFEQGKYNRGIEYFNRSVKYGADDEIASWIAWYIRRLEVA
ncbi:MAG: hypothetical protein K5927_07635 [Lachnospiraceae bacterium]|nr:hypothetical protein [Lachnospiraceae bacterium]